ncbi:ATPase [Nocardiopsis sp. LOL_012]|uniref:ATPase n=1 Tax=Nocardiopsis sp. LOL_012 TaxID=3345409 RepID=UPI003A8906FB
MSVTEKGRVSARAVSGDRLPRRVGRAVLRPFRPVDEVSRAIAVGHRLQRSTATGRRIVVDDLGTGTDTAVVTALLARAFAHFRNDRVLAVDATGRTPSLAGRLDTVDAYLEAEVNGLDFGTAREGLAEAGSGLWTVAVRADDTETARLTSLFRFFGLTLVAGTPGRLADALGSTAHARVWAVRATREAAARVGRALDGLTRRGRGDEARRTVVVLFDERRGEDPGFDAVRAAAILAESGAAVVRLAHDRHLAHARAVRTRRVAEATHRTVLQVAAEVLERSAEGGADPRRREGERA